MYKKFSFLNINIWYRNHIFKISPVPCNLADMWNPDPEATLHTILSSITYQKPVFVFITWESQLSNFVYYSILPSNQFLIQTSSLWSWQPDLTKKLSKIIHLCEVHTDVSCSEEQFLYKSGIAGLWHGNLVTIMGIAIMLTNCFGWSL